MTDFLARTRSPEARTVGTWVKLPTIETMEMLGHAGFDFVIIDMEHGPHTHEIVYRLIFAAQAMGMSALVRLADASAADAQRVLDAGADGVLVPRVTSLEAAAATMDRLVFSPAGDRGLGSTSRAGRWGMIPLSDYLERGAARTLRMVQLEDLAALEQVEAFVDVEGVNGVFLGLADLMLSSGLKPADPAVQALAARALKACEARGIPCGVAVGTAADGLAYRDMGFRMVTVSNDCTLFGKAAQAAVAGYRA